MERLRSRATAGRRLASVLRHYEREPDPVILALPRGGVPVAFEVARALRAPLDVFVVRKLGVPGQEELALGAIASGGVRVLNQDVVSALGLSDDAIAEIAAREEIELERRERAYRRGLPPVDVTGKTVFLIDDGLATGATMLAAVKAVRERHPRKIIVAVPVAPADTCQKLRAYVDEVTCLHVPTPFLGVGEWYVDFSQTTDDEVTTLLDKARTLDWIAGDRPETRGSETKPGARS